MTGEPTDGPREPRCLYCWDTGWIGGALRSKCGRCPPPEPMTISNETSSTQTARFPHIPHPGNRQQRRAAAARERARR